MKEWRMATKEEINNMTFQEAEEIIQRMINLGHNKGEYRPREHFTKALEIILNKAKENTQAIASPSYIYVKRINLFLDYFIYL